MPHIATHRITPGITLPSTTLLALITLRPDFRIADKGPPGKALQSSVTHAAANSQHAQKKKGLGIAKALFLSFLLAA